MAHAVEGHGGEEDGPQNDFLEGDGPARLLAGIAQDAYNECAQQRPENASRAAPEPHASNDGGSDPLQCQPRAGHWVRLPRGGRLRHAREAKAEPGNGINEGFGPADGDAAKTGGALAGAEGGGVPAKNAAPPNHRQQRGPEKNDPDTGRKRHPRDAGKRPNTYSKSARPLRQRNRSGGEPRRRTLGNRECAQGKGPRGSPQQGGQRTVEKADRPPGQHAHPQGGGSAHPPLEEVGRKDAGEGGYGSGAQVDPAA